jgi:hypothetical protein
MRRIFRAAKSAVVLCLVFMMTVDTANACRIFQWLFAHRAACTTSCAADMGVTMSPVGCQVIHATPVDCCEAIEVVGQLVVEEAHHEEDGDASPVDVAPSDSIVAPPIAEDEEIPVPAPPAQLADDGPVLEAADTAPADENEANDPVIADEQVTDEPVVNPLEEPVDDLAPADPPVEEPAANVGDDLFGDAPAEGDAGAATDDLFGDTPADAAAAPANDMAPADAGGDDLFDAPANSDAGTGDDLFGDTPADAAAAPANDVAPADAGGDDLFDAPADSDAVAGDDLFGDAPADDAAGGDALFDADPADAGDAGDDLFDAAPADDAGGDDLFDASDADASDADASDADAVDDLFGQSRTPAGMRVWTDNTGKYQTAGRLVVIAKTHVRLLKSNGRYSTVPLTRLSGSDLDYVLAVAVKLTQSQRLASR